MTQRPLCSIVLAAGQGKRMRAPGPKVLVRACGRTLVEHVLEALRPLEARPTVVVYGHGGDAVREALAGRDLRFAHQPEQRGTGHAVQCALPELEGFDGDVLVVCGDTPLLSAEVLRELVGNHRRAGRAATVLSAELENPGSLGRILRDGRGKLRAIREAADATPVERGVREINTGVMVLRSDLLADALGRLTADNVQGEHYLTDVPGLLLADGHRVEAHRTSDAGAALGVNNPLELGEAVRLLRRRALEAALAGGVWIDDPQTTRLDAGVEIGEGTRVLPFTLLGPDVRIGKDCRIGPHATLRGGVVVGDGVELGAGVEVRAATIEAGARIPGPARLVRVAVGRDAFVGPGVVTTDAGDQRVVIGDGARIGAGAVLQAPLTIGERARVDPGAVLAGGASVPGGGNQP